jgi:hypothetical protein
VSHRILPALVLAAAILVTSAVGRPSFAQPASPDDTLYSPEELASYREKQELRRRTLRILRRADVENPSGVVDVETDTAELRTRVRYVDFDPPEKALYRVRNALAAYFEGKPVQDRNVRLNFDVPGHSPDADRPDRCGPELTNRDVIERAMAALVGRHPDAQSGSGLEARLRPRVARAKLLVSWQGEVLEVEVEKGTGDEWLDGFLVPLLRELKFRPGLVRGVPVDMWVTHRVDFREVL